MKNSLLALAALAATLTSHAGPTFDSTTGVLTMTDVTVDGKLFFDNLNLKLNLATGTFELVSIKEKNKTISTTPLQTYSANNITVDLMGCYRNTTTEITCYLKITNFNSDPIVRIYNSSRMDISKNTYLYDDIGNQYPAYILFSGKTDSPVNSNYLDIDAHFNVSALTEIPIQVSFIFKGIDSRATSISTFRPGFRYVKTSSDFQASFKNISF